jgi:threonine dehydrogenase-like Zn-dependent dehydrogenase
MQVEFSTPEYQADGSFRNAEYRFTGSSEAGWEIGRNGKHHLQLGPGYRLLKTVSCGVCSTDLARQFLPFPLPQVTGHEVLATDDSGGRVVAEINASHHARGMVSKCPFCTNGLATHCPERLVLGIHDLPGGFGPYVLAPIKAVLPLPDSIPDNAGVLVEPLAAALNAVAMIGPKAGETVAVLGPRRLGMLVVAALGAWRESSGIEFGILTLARHQGLLDLSRQFGANETALVDGEGDRLPAGLADVVIDTTGNPKAFELAIRLARREVHLKSTHGQPSAGLGHLTELVVDELRVGRYEPSATEGKRVAWLSGAAPPGGTVFQGAADSISHALEETSGDQLLPRADLAVVDSSEQVDLAIRPRADDQKSLVKPRGDILIRPESGVDSGSILVREVARRGLRLTSSRCGDFRKAIRLLEENEGLRSVGDKLITQRFDNHDMNAVFATARSAECIKAVVDLGQ